MPRTTIHVHSDAPYDIVAAAAEAAVASVDPTALVGVGETHDGFDVTAFLPRGTEEVVGAALLAHEHVTDITYRTVTR